MVDFKMDMAAQKPTPQRVSVAKALQPLSPKRYMNSVRDKSFVEFCISVQKSWRVWLARMKQAEYPPLDTKKFGYARNCPPVLVDVGVPGGRKLQPCNIRLCPFCHGRKVMKIHEALCGTLNALSLDSEKSKEESLGVRYGHFDVGYSSWNNSGSLPVLSVYCFDKMNEIFEEQGVFQGTVSNRLFWVETEERGFTVKGRLSFAGVNCLSGGKDQDHYLEQVESSGIQGLFDFNLENQVWGQGCDKPKFIPPKIVGEAFSYPPGALYLGTEDGPELTRVLTHVQDEKWRLYRTAGICRGAHSITSSSRRSDTATWRSDLDDKLIQITDRLTEIEQSLDKIRIFTKPERKEETQDE